MAARLALVVFLVVALVACGRTPLPSELAGLASAAPTLMRESGVVPASQWPPAIARLKPEQVYVAPEGLYVTTSSLFVQEWGLFVPRAAGFAAQLGTDPSYTALGQGVFSYHVKG